jgi:hypothetical protein
LHSAGFGSPGSTITQIQKEENYNFLLGRLAEFEVRQDALKESLGRDQTGSSSAAPLDPRREARDLLEAAVAAAVAAPNEGRDDPLQLLWNDRELPATAVFSLPPGASLSTNDMLAASLAGASLQSAPDPVDSELDALMQRDDLSTETRREVSQRIGQGKFRAALLQLFGCCAVTGVTTPEVLRAAHIHRWADCADTQGDRRNIDNGLLLTATIDALFETGLITFGDDGLISISPRLGADAQSRLGIHAQMRLSRAPSARQRMYLKKHRERTRAVHEADDTRVALATS